jgi:hypothetical protein
MMLLFALAKISAYAIGSIAAHSVPEAMVNGMDKTFGNKPNLVQAG